MLDTKSTSLFCIGLSYKTADEALRGQYSLAYSQIQQLLQSYKEEGIQSVMVISTCNRTEIYGLVAHPFKLIRQFIEHTLGDISKFEQIAYVYKNKQAIQHLFEVGTGLDSQILGDFEIVSQLKKSFSLSKKIQLIDPFIERLYNSVIQASKRVKNETEISSGATSVAFAAVQYIMNNVDDPSNKNILLFGTGKIGRNACENLVKHLSNKHVTVINRTQETAKAIAGKFQLTYKPYQALEDELKKTDILIVATGARTETITKKLIHKDKSMLILDLSIPKNVSTQVSELPNVTTLHLDYLSELTDQALERRKKHLPKAKSIIKEVKNDFDQWLDNRKYAPVIKALKEKLNTMKDAEIDFQNKKIKNLHTNHVDIFADRFIQKITTHFANHLKSDDQNSDESLKVIKTVFQLDNHS